MTEAKIQPSEYSKKECEEQHNNKIRGRRVEDELRLRELELETNFQIQTLSQSLSNLKMDFVSWRDSLNEKLEDSKREVRALNTRMTIVIVLLLGELAGGGALVSRLIGI